MKRRDATVKPVWEARLSEEHLGDKAMLNHAEGSVTEWVAPTLHFVSGKKPHHYSSIFFAYIVEADHWEKQKKKIKKQTKYYMTTKYT